MGPPADDLIRVSSILDYLGEPTAWSDGRTLACEHQRGNRTCGVKFSLLSNHHFRDETERLRSQNGVLTGPASGACGTAYIDAPDEFAFNGTNARKGARHRGVRLIHKPCRGKKGSRFTVSVHHARQKDRSDNIRILSELVNNVAINGLRRVLAPAPGTSEAGVARIYDRIFWLERVLLAYEKAQLAQWRARLAREGRPRHTRIAHDDIVLTVNWETAKDTRVTSLTCAVSADIQSGYVFRIDVDFDPTVDPVSLLDALLFDQDKVGDSLYKVYRKTNGEAFISPRMSFQRPTGRFDEPALFASAVAQLRIFANRAVGALDASVAPVLPSTLQAIDEAYERADMLEMLWNYDFNFGAPEREGRNAFSGIMTRNTYTKAAHLACLKEMLPEGKLTLVGEQEASMARMIPHIFREAILADRFEWHVVTFDKNAKKPQIVRRTKAFDNAFRAFRDANPQISVPDALHAWTRTQLKPATKESSKQIPEPFPSSNFDTKAFPALWIKSPIQASGETNKIIGFPLLSPRYRRAYRRLGFQDTIRDPDLLDAITRRVINATLQPASTFMNSLRDRLAFAKRAGGRASRSGGTYINGAAYNPRVLIALLTIFRIHYNFFEVRQYVSPINKHEETDDTQDGTTSLAVPRTDRRIEVPKRRRRAPLKRSPAMRAGIQSVKPDNENPKLPNLAKVLYQPWIFHGTPLWGRLQRR
ncbi:hypothetical protein [uncultured Paracoccus sp.]|uniref:hypothetical protein n=1 Tax=uncultured Paracoccus sp. TaxID=189685 RepID=UPI0025D8E5C8|nr:hypothetical protein [uncultured Paracoccus sp.]